MRSPLAIVAPGVAALALVACSAPEANDPLPTAGPATSSAPAQSASPSPSPTASPSPSPTGPGNFAAATGAGGAALELVDGGSLVSLKTATSGGKGVWKVELVTEDGDEQELEVAADGSEVTKTGKVDRQDAGDRRNNLAELDAATVGYADAIGALPASVAGGTISQLDLDTEGSRTVWEAEVADASGVRHEIRIDAANGAVLGDKT